MNFLQTNKMMHHVATGKNIYYKSSDIYRDVNHDAVSGAVLSLFHLVFTTCTMEINN